MREHSTLVIGATDWPGLAKLIEETSELGQVVGKLIAYPGGEHPDLGPPLRERLEDEIADVLAAIMYVRAHNVLDRGRMDARVIEKFERFQRWDHEERDA
jgi:NTP pyrophosphatase (non-canonical NTP hydrolase)